MNSLGSRRQEGFSLIEVVIATGVLLAISGIVTSAVLRMTSAQQTIWNRTEMHSGVRSATELLQQEIGQAGRTTLPSSGITTLSTTVSSTSTTATVASTNGMFIGELLIFAPKGIDSNDSSTAEETVKVTQINSNQITINQITSTGVTASNFHYSHQAGAIVKPSGGFGSGVVSPFITNGSSATKLKLYGDINGDYNMVYIEYRCDTTNGSLYRTVLPWDASPSLKPANPTADLVLLSNITQNPPVTTGGTPLPCFQYQMDPFNNYVLDVAVTLTVQSQSPDPITKVKQTETKALLNVSPRNVISAWQSAGGNVDRVQPMPATITALLP
jgi:type II secretory pathway pseudopilin PulG